MTDLNTRVHPYESVAVDVDAHSSVFGVVRVAASAAVSGSPVTVAVFDSVYSVMIFSDVDSMISVDPVVAVISVLALAHSL